ncbi:succinylglutamate desuccinylase/aspartoacylase family protein [Echinimonas agarilytica]|uniref:Succinylglutamate desuccinylase/aspartoacylase family protein n=1 Tax=Echinimonas agarilytica TaxID=1215918 RepID=A0AA41W6L0_9GAMM|nr:succinylglutamate desuccinylase/aspartoacylase family protein [Echinimonas agarilytica]MCM2679591.1 succinylglutamate desuccinylase/aspartoacylase family protein [Echinimonas agarilytica]
MSMYFALLTPHFLAAQEQALLNENEDITPTFARETSHENLPDADLITDVEIGSAELVGEAVEAESSQGLPVADSAAYPQLQSANNEAVEPEWGNLELLGGSVAPGTEQALGWFSGHLPGGFQMATPVVIVHGSEPGPRICLTAALHGDEVNGVEIARRVVQNIDPAQLKGSIISVPVVNMDGLWRKDRYMSDRRDLNRAFPGSPNGTTAAQVAYSLFNNIVKHCDSLIDLHSGSMYRENLPQLRADLTTTAVADMASEFGEIAVLQSLAPLGSLRGSATAAGIPTVVMEVGGPFTLDVGMVEISVKSVRSYLASQGMIKRSYFWSKPQPIFYESKWVRSRQGGILINEVELGEKPRKGKLLGVVRNPITDSVEEIRAPFDAVVLGRAQNQFVSAGYAVYNLGKRSTFEDLEQKGEVVKKSVARKNAQELGLNDGIVPPEANVQPEEPPLPSEQIIDEQNPEIEPVHQATESGSVMRETRNNQAAEEAVSKVKIELNTVPTEQHALSTEISLELAPSQQVANPGDIKLSENIVNQESPEGTSDSQRSTPEQSSMDDLSEDEH